MKIKINQSYLFFIIIILITLFLFYYIYNKYNNNILKKNIIKKLNNSYELFHNIKNKELFSNKNNISNQNDIINKKVNDNIEYSYYKSNKHDSYNMLNRDLILYSRNNIKNSENNVNNNKKKNLYDSLSLKRIEHMSTIQEEQNMNDLFPDLDKSSFSLTKDDKPSDLLVKQEFEPDKTVMSDALLKMDTRPDEQKELDSLLDDLNVYIYLLKNTIITDLNNKRDISINKKIELYYNLFKDTYYMAKQANQIYNSNKEIPNYIFDKNLDTNVDLYLSENNSLSLSIINIYKNILDEKDIQNNKDLLIQLNVPIPKNLDSEEEDDIIDPLTILREFADNIKYMYDSLNTIIVPYYNFVFELGIAPYPKDNDTQDPNSPDNKAGAALIASFMSEMISFSSNYNDLMINYIMNENVYISLILNKDYKNNLFKLPNLSSENITNLEELYSRKIIDDNQISLFDKTAEDITIIYNYFITLYYLMKADPDPEKIDVDTIEKILKGNLTFNKEDRFSLFKKYNPTIDNDQYTFGIKNMVTNTEYPFISLINGFSTEKSVPSGPSKATISKAKENLANNMKKALEDAERALKEATEKAAKEIERTANVVAKETTQAANVVAKETTQAANVVAKETTEIAKDIDKGAKKVGKSIIKAFKIK